MSRWLVVGLGLALNTLGSGCEFAGHDAADDAPGDAAAASDVEGRLLAGELFSAGRQPIVTGWEHSSSRLLAAECRECHEQEHAQWRSSMHARAWTNSRFQAAYAKEPKAWCRHCHAPLAAQEAGLLSREEGIGCAACHVREGTIVSSRALAPTPDHHGVRGVRGYSTPTLCAGCHQFNFPLSASGEGITYSEEPMQDTVEEWRNSGSAGCNSCHAGGHRWSGPNDVEWLRSQFGPAKLRQLEPGVLSLRIELGARGHSLPTGDPFRSLVLEISEQEDHAQPVLRRRYGREFDGKLKSPFELIAAGESRDTRIPADRNALTVSFDRRPADTLYARLRFFFTDPWLHGRWTPDTASAHDVWQQRFTLSNLESEHRP